MLRIALVAACLLLAGCATPPDCTTKPTGARGSYHYYTNTTEQEMQTLLTTSGWADVTKNPDAPGIGLSARTTHANQTMTIALNAFAYGGPAADQPVVGVGIRADNANVTSQDAARTLLAPLIDILKANAPTEWGETTTETYSGGDEICVA